MGFGHHHPHFFANTALSAFLVLAVGLPPPRRVLCAQVLPEFGVTEFWYFTTAARRSGHPLRWMLEPLLPINQIETCFRFVRGRWVLPEADLAAIHGVTRHRLLKCLQPREPLPGEFCFYLEGWELPALGVMPRRDGWAPLVFTEAGAMAAACSLGSAEAVKQSIQVARSFARLRQEGLVYIADLAAIPIISEAAPDPFSRTARNARTLESPARKMEDIPSFRENSNHRTRKILAAVEA